MVMAVTGVLSLEVQELIARVRNRIHETDEVVAITRVLVRETLHTLRPRMAAFSSSDAGPTENDWRTSEITAYREPERI
jgi:hypothetical protein